MDLGADDGVCEEEPDPSQVEHPTWTPGSPMQQSPDQSSFNDKSPELTDLDIQEDLMDTTDAKPESASVSIEGEEANENEMSESNTQEDDEDIAGVEAEHEDSHSSEQVCGAFESAMTPVEMDEQDVESDSSGEINEEFEAKAMPGTGAEVYNSDVVSSDNECGSTVDGANIDENEAANETETEAADKVESEKELQVDCDAKRDSPELLHVSSEENAEDGNIVSDESEDEKPMTDDVNELVTSVNQNNSNIANISGSDRMRDQFEYESIKERSQSPGSPEVSSTSLDKAVSESIQKAQDDDVQFSRQIDNVCPETDQEPSYCRQEIYSFKYSNSDKFTGRGSFVLAQSDVTNVGGLQQSINIVEKGSLDSNELDNLSTLSVKGSSNSISGDDEDNDDDEDDNLDLTEGSEETEKVHLNVSQREIAERRTHSDIQTDMAAKNVASSTNVIKEDLLKNEKTKTVEELIDRHPEVEEGEIDSADMDKQDEDKRSEASLEEVSDEEEDGELAVGDRGSISGMEEISSEEEDEPDDEGDKKAESGMEEVSDEEEESCEETVTVNGVEDVSSDEDELETDLKKVEEVRASKTRIVEVKQRKSKSKEVIQIDDTGKEDGAIVKEILENMIRQIENNKSENKTDVVPKRRKSKDKKERRESVKYRFTSSSIKDTRDINERLKAQACYGDDVELDYDDTVHDESKDKQASESDGEITSDTSSSDGELEEEECEEGEIKEPGQKPYIKPTCRFFMRGHCTWGINCRFLHPGVNDKGYYQLIERPGFNNKPPPPFEDKWEEEEEIERTPSPEPPPPAPEPKEETAWERGLRQAKELRKKALERREMETNFEHKKMNLSIEDNPEYDKENTVEEVVVVEKSPKKSPVKKQPYYDKYEPLSDDEYYDQTPVRLQQKQLEQSWMHGQYENFEVNWTQDQYGIPPRGPYPPPRYQYPPEHHAMRGRERIALRPSPRRFSQSPPPMQQRQRQMRPPQHEPREMVRREKVRDMSPPPQKYPPPSPGRGRGRGRGRPRADDWNDPWTRANANKPKSPKKRSRSRGRRRSRRSYSYSSSYSTSSYSGSSRSRSRSSSYSSVSSHSSRSSSNSRSRSPAPRLVPKHGMRRPVPAGNQQNQPMKRPPVQARPSEPPKSSVTVQVRPGKVPERPDRRPSGVSNSRSGANPVAATKPVKGPAPPPGRQPSSVGQPPNRGPPSRQPSDRQPPNRQPPNRQTSPRQPPSKTMGQQIADVGHGRKPPQKAAAAPPAQSQRKFQMAVKTRDRPLPQSALSKDKPKGKPMSRKRKASSSSSRSRSRSRSSSSSSRSSYSSRSSRSYSRSRSSSSSSSGSADSDHLYRNIGARDDQRPVPVGRGKPDLARQHGRQPAAGRVMPGKQGLKPTIGETSRPSSVAQAKVVKDPLKMTGLKSNIKLTLIKQSEKPPPGSVPDVVSRKRPSEPIQDAPPMKRPAIQNPQKIEKPVKKSEKIVPVSPVKVPARPPGPAKPILGAPGVATATVKKKSTVSRREELLKQLKAVEDAIAKKKKKMG